MTSALQRIGSCYYVTVVLVREFDRFDERLVTGDEAVWYGLDHKLDLQSYGTATCDRPHKKVSIGRDKEQVEVDIVVEKGPQIGC